MVIHGPKLVCYGSRSVFMIIHGSRLVFLGDNLKVIIFDDRQAEITLVPCSSNGAEGS